MSEEELNAIWDQSADTGGDAGGEPAPSSQPEAEAPPEQGAEQQAPVYKYTANGREVEEPIDVILKRASQGYNYAQLVDGLKSKEQEIQQRYEQAQQMESRWKQFDEYARQNPAWAEHVQQMWDNRHSVASDGEQSGDQPRIDPALNKELSSLKQQVEQISKFTESWQAQQADKAYYDQYNTVKEKYPHIDLQQSDPLTGKTLEYQVLEFARDNGIKKFDHAFKLFHHDKLMDLEKDNIKKQVLEEVQKNRKAGIVGYSAKPTQGQTGTDVRALSDDQLTEAILNDKELSW